MYKVLVIAGTTDAKHIIDKLMENNFEVAATVTTRLGSELLNSSGDIDIYEGRITQRRMASLLEKLNPICLVDASNPFAMDISRNAMNVCSKFNTPYIRFKREEILYEEKDVIKVKDYEKAYKELLQLKGNILLTVGSRKIDIFTKLPEYKERVYLRVLPDCKVIGKCEKLGFNAKNLLAIKGPFTEELNIELMKYCNATVLVTKESGNTGGISEKINAAKTMNIPIIMIERAELECENNASSFSEILDYINELVLVASNA